jgi:hypothetical protein
MTDQPQEDLDKAAKLTRAITDRQIDSAVAMRCDPQNWVLTPIDGTTRTIYRRVK